MGGQSVAVIFFMMLVVQASSKFPFKPPIPFVLFHGLNSHCGSQWPAGYVKRLAEWSNANGYCMEIGNGTWTSWFIPLDKQVEEACNKVKAMKELSNGYNIVAMSQGALIGRGVVQFCEGAPKVNNLISIASPQAGIAACPHYRGASSIANTIMKAGIYSDYVQKRLAPSGYTKLPKDIKGYMQKCSFLPKLNNERPDQRNPRYKKRLTSLKNLVLIMNENDSVLKPKESAWFGYYADGDLKTILEPQQTKLYNEDWIGLKTLDNARRVRFIRVPGAHCEVPDTDVKKYIVPYLKHKRLIPENEMEDGGAEVADHHQKASDNLESINVG